VGAKICGTPKLSLAILICSVRMIGGFEYCAEEDKMQSRNEKINK
jgi:hypothetical protein